MGQCLSCLGIGRQNGADAERSRLLYTDDPYAQGGYGTYGGQGAGIAPQNLMSAEEVRREQDALDNIPRWANDQVVDIFPHQHKNLASSTAQVNGSSSTAPTPEHHDILLSMIPGDKSKKSIRIYPASRPGSEAGQRSIRSKSSNAKLNGGQRSRDSSVLVKLNVDMT